MATWLVTAVTFIPDVVKLAMHFTRGKPKDNPTDIFAKQISELQDAAIRSAGWAKELAAGLENEIAELRTKLAASNARSELLEIEIRTTRIVCIVAATAAGLAFLVAVYAIAR